MSQISNRKLSNMQISTVSCIFFVYLKLYLFRSLSFVRFAFAFEQNWPRMVIWSPAFHIQFICLFTFHRELLLLFPRALYIIFFHRIIIFIRSLLYVWFYEIRCFTFECRREFWICEYLIHIVNARIEVKRREKGCIRGCEMYKYHRSLYIDITNVADASNGAEQLTKDKKKNTCSTLEKHRNETKYGLHKKRDTTSGRAACECENCLCAMIAIYIYI